ncbi:MAG: hypothetical protein HY341_02085 [Candidatus Kerfeldbacteria bacterium]|nr:hypothetical protein [Candidatus Kerfeldbacteria bacterium]
MSLSTTQDVLNIVIAFSVLLFTAFLVWLLYYFIRMVRDASTMVHETREKIEELGSLIETLREKLTSSASTVGLAAKGVSQIVSYVQHRRDRKTKGKKSSAE